MPSNVLIQKLKVELLERYVDYLGLTSSYLYLNGNPVRPVFPKQTACGTYFIIGAYPSARFSVVGSETNVPVHDLDAPFSDETYQDGARVRTVKSSKELEENYLQLLSISRHDCWITNLVKIFLFKKGHVEKYKRLGCSWEPFETRSKFDDFGRASIKWLAKELQIAQPCLVITLGREVAGILRDVKSDEKRNQLLGGQLQEMTIEGEIYPVIHLAHPGIVMCAESDQNPWPRRHREEHIPEARKVIEAI